MPDRRGACLPGAGKAEKRAQLENIILIGMPGSGKTSLGQEAARLCGMGFVDVDELITMRTKRSITDLFEQDGEESFRKVETEILTNLIVLSEFAVRVGLASETNLEDQANSVSQTEPIATADPVSTKSAVVISAGGGVVTQKRNYEILRQLGRIVYIFRDIEAIAGDVAFSEERPLLQSREQLRVLWAQRKDLYPAWADIVFPADGEFNSAVLRLAELMRRMMENPSAVPPRNHV